MKISLGTMSLTGRGGREPRLPGIQVPAWITHSQRTKVGTWKYKVLFFCEISFRGCSYGGGGFRPITLEKMILS